MTSTPLAVNCSILLTDRDVSARLDAVREAGFTAVEFWWPFSVATPAEAEVEAFVGAVRDSGLQLVALNLFAGDMPGGDRGVVSWPGREDELRASAELAARIGAELGCRLFNALYGNRRPDAAAAAQDDLAVQNLGAVAAELDRVDGTVLVEAVSGAEAYPLRTADDVVDVLERVEAETGAGNLGLLLDVYHLATNGDDVPAAITRHRDRIAHVQLADAPGRGAPGSGTLPLRGWVEDMRSGDYPGWFALEYRNDETNPDHLARTHEVLS